MPDSLSKASQSVETNQRLLWLHLPQESPNLSFWQQLEEKPYKLLLLEKEVTGLASSPCAVKAPTEEMVCDHNNIEICLLQLLYQFLHPHAVSAVCPGQRHSEDTGEYRSHVFLGYYSCPNLHSEILSKVRKKWSVDARGSSRRWKGSVLTACLLPFSPLFSALLLSSNFSILDIFYCFLNIDMLKPQWKDHLLKPEW